MNDNKNYEYEQVDIFKNDVSENQNLIKDCNLKKKTLGAPTKNKNKIINKSSRWEMGTIITHLSEEEEDTQKIGKDGNVISTESPNEIEITTSNVMKDVNYYSRSKSHYTKVGKFIINNNIPSTIEEIHLTGRDFFSLVSKNGWVDGQIIDTFAVCQEKSWNNSSFLLTDDTQTALGDYTHKRRLITSHSLYNLKKQLKEIIFMPYCFEYHWRLLIIDTRKEIITLLDPYEKIYEEATDMKRVYGEFIKFVDNCDKNSAFGKWKSVNWSTKLYEDKRPHQSNKDGSSCGVFVSYFMDIIGKNRSMDLHFNPQNYRREIADVIVKNIDFNLSHCVYCFSSVKRQNFFNCNQCSGKIHISCGFKGEVESEKEDEKGYILEIRKKKIYPTSYKWTKKP